LHHLNLLGSSLSGDGRWLAVFGIPSMSIRAFFVNLNEEVLRSTSNKTKREAILLCQPPVRFCVEVGFQFQHITESQEAIRLAH
jgi:hypothetical protein